MHIFGWWRNMYCLFPSLGTSVFSQCFTCVRKGVILKPFLLNLLKSLYTWLKRGLERDF